ncbi:MAG: hypothetical protein A3H97_21805 [Acidobacteria bacterium RIFCSPLOWO2_02_FULL_65_29]|nr:MAG: hypothetical protein A3H97_21805 [Acidobacteria bacterium RIFCSPLOWO2_02_FULL_65_29]
MRLRVGAATDVGRQRTNNEDAYASLPDQGLFVLCDGMGGTAAGEVASRLAVDTIVGQLKAAESTGRADPSGEGEDGYLLETAQLAEAVRRSNRSIYEQAQQNAGQAEMGTTVVGAWIRQNMASLAHVGDSRAYLWHGHRLEALTNDHSLVEARVQAGLLDREESLKSEDQNILLRALGREPDVDVDLHEVPLQPGDYLVLCSDGLTRMVPDGEMAEAIARVREPELICRHLVDAANRNGGVDNITVIVVEVEEGWWRRLWNRWGRPSGGGRNATVSPAV